MKPVFKKGIITCNIRDSYVQYIDIMPYQFVCYENFNNDEVWSWCLNNIGSNMNWMVCFTGVMLRNEDDAIHFALRWC